MRVHRLWRKRQKKYLFILLTCIVILVPILLTTKFHSTNKSEIAAKTTLKSQKNVEITEYQAPENFGANGFDKEVDTDALQKAIDSGNSITLRSGATYIIDRPLISSHSIKITTDGEKAAVILQHSNKSALILDNKPITNTFVTEPISRKQSYVVLASTKGIEPGFLLHLKSTKLWYWDDRGYLKKGELHKVTKVVGNKVFLDEELVESYPVGTEESVSAIVYPNVSLQIENISFAHPKPTNTIMVDVNYTINSKFNRVTVKNSKRTGILLNTTYQTEVHDCTIDLGTTRDINTGYGIQDYGGSGTLITDSSFKRVRRGVDFSGSTPSRFGMVKNSKSFGYKKGKLASGNSGFGTHSTAQYITFENNYVENFDYAFLTRGSHITVKNNNAKGYSRSFIAITFGNNVKVLNNTYQSVNGSTLEMFILFLNTYQGSIEATGNVVESLHGPFIKGDIEKLESLSIGGNIINRK